MLATTHALPQSGDAKELCLPESKLNYSTFELRDLQPRSNIQLWQGINLYQRTADGVVHATDNRSHIAHRERADDGRLQITRRRQTGGLNLRFLGRVDPIIVRGDERAGGVV